MNLGLEYSKKRDIHLNIDDNLKKDSYNFRAFEMDISTIFTNLINNSIDSFNNLTEPQERLIDINFNLKKESIEIIYSDNGIGLDKVFEDDKDEIFLPFKTAKRDRKVFKIKYKFFVWMIYQITNISWNFF